MRTLPLLLLPLALAACDGKGTSVTINATSDDGENSTFAMNNGTVAIKGGGFEGNFKVPAIKMTADNFDMDGVKLYPNSAITSFNIDAQDHAGDKKDEGKVTAAFSSPAPLATVQAWFRDKLTAKNFKFAAQGDGFAGTTDDGESFTINLSADGGDKTKGRMEIVGS
ncbi:hypothetical protein HZY97_10770 [Sphingomonas sp. R-74633]|uniref:hypothetical protein n=1 Tax=Sphingomonas sp. R-74633 TaxID=2751188 RepID=UPI0015D141E8|nr:hypothetical protein [Sphingomonas sp. R-74633]NYT41241.1 hypothetical protein [Sphingomonas sp. R-74633]